MTEPPLQMHAFAVAPGEPVESAPEIVEFEPDAEGASRAELLEWTRSLVLEEQLDAADTWATRLIRRFPTDPEALTLWAEIAMRLGAWDEAVMRWAAVRAVATRFARAYVDGARAFDELGRSDEADALLAIGRQRSAGDIWIASVWAEYPARRENWAEAVRRWTELRSDFPDRADTVVPYARVLTASGDGAAAEALLEAEAIQFPGERPLLVMHADMAMQRQDWEAAAARWAVVREQFPGEIPAYVHAARALDELGRGTEADAVLEEARRRAPDDIGIVSVWADHPGRSGDLPEAARRWGEVHARFPDRAEVVMSYVRVLAAAGQEETAGALLQGVADRFPEQSHLLIGWAEAMTRARDWPEAANRWIRVHELRPQDPQPVIEGARALIETGRLEEADALLAGGQATHPGNQTIAATWATVSMRRQLWPEAARRWERFRRDFATDAAGWFEGGRALTNAGDPDAADALLAEGRERFPDSAELLCRWAEVPRHRRDWDETLRRWAVVRERFPAEPRGWVEAARTLSDTWRGEEANALMEEAVVRLPTVFDVAFFWALIGARTRPQPEALARWAKVRAEFPHRATGYVFSAHCMQDLGLAAEAEALIVEALQLFPDQLEVLRVWAELAVRRGELETAAERLRQCAARFPGDIGVVRARTDTLLSLQSHDEARAALDEARRIWPHDLGFLRQRLMLSVSRGEMDEAFALWRATVADMDVDRGVVRELGWAMVKENLASAQAREVFLFLGQEPDTGARDWLPIIADLERVRGVRPGLMDVGREVVSTTPTEHFDPATLDVLKCALLFDVSDDDIRRFLRNYAAKGRHALMAKLFCQNYWKPKPSRVADFKRVFDQYMAEWLADPARIASADPIEWLAYLNFAAVFSVGIYRELIGSARQLLDIAVLARDRSLRTAESIVGTIASLAPADDALVRQADDLSASPPAPALAFVPMRLRIALCISGQLRGYEAAHPSWSRLGLDRHEVTRFVHVWQDIGRNWQRIWAFLRRDPFLWDTFVRPNSIAFLRPRYPILMEAALLGSEVDERRMSEFYDTPHVRVEDDRTGEFRGKVNLWKMHYKIEQAHKLAQSAGGDFDLIVRLRPDKEIDSADIDWREIYWRSRESRSLYADDAFVFTEKYTWLADQFAAATPEVMNVYATVFSDLNRMMQTQLVPLDVLPEFRPHSNLFCLMFYRGILGRTVPGIKFGRLLDPAMLSPEEVLELARQDIADREPDSLDERFIAVCEEEIRERARHAR